MRQHPIPIQLYNFLFFYTLQPVVSSLAEIAAAITLRHSRDSSSSLTSLASLYFFSFLFIP
jgi:hypothetical protein